MIALLQRVSHAAVLIEDTYVAQIKQGMLVMVAFEPHDKEEDLPNRVHKLLHYRLFADANDKMNQNVQQAQAQILLVPQFTLAANTQSGLRPSFSSCMPPQQAKKLFTQLVALCQKSYPNQVQQGVFGANMQVSLCNDGPVTFNLHW